MIRLLNTNFGELVPQADWDVLSEFRLLSGIRQDIRAGGTLVDVAALVSNALPTKQSYGMFVVDTDGAPELSSYVARTARALGAQARVIVEPGNEEDGEPEWREAPGMYGRLVAEVARAVARVDSGVRVISGGTRSTSREAMAWLRLVAAQLPAEVGVGYHTYRSGPPDEPLPGYRSRGDEFAALREVAAGRAIWNTEVGWHTAPRKKGFPLCWQTERRSDQQVTEYLRTEMAINQANGSESFVVYQWGDGPTDTPLDRFGIRRFDGTLKPQAEAFR